MKLVKGLFIGLIILLLLAIGAVIAVALNLGQIVEEAVETHGPDVTSTPVELAGVSINLLGGGAELTGFDVANPPGFSQPSAVQADTLRLKVDPFSFRDGVLVIEDITIDGVKITAEQKGFTTNLQEIHKAVKQFAEAAGGGASSKQEAGSSDGEEIRFMVNNLYVANNTLSLVTENYGSYQLEIPALTRTGLDGGGAGLTPKELGVALLQPLLDEAEKKVKTRLKSLAKTEVEDKVKAKIEEQLDDETKSKVEALKNLFGR